MMGAAQVTHMPGITGLRGVAVAAVVAYHLGYLPGGFLGVDVFFVLSGFLITTLLLTVTPEGPRGLATWWGRRFRRLTPAVAVVVLAVLAVFLTQSGIVIDAIATLTWWQNWHLVAEGTPYWASEPSPLRHAWSLSIEEQFYLVWPALLLALLAVARRSTDHRATGRRRGRQAVLAVAVLGTLASFGWATYLVLATDTALSRIYFGTDTRAGALLIGAALGAATLTAQRRTARAVRTAAAVLALAVLGSLTVVLTPDLRATYTGGLALAALCALVLVDGAARQGPLTRVLDLKPLQWLGIHSYAIYLWSWPIQVALEQRLPDWPRWSVAAVTVAGSLLASFLSLRVVEDPMRRSSSWAQRVVPRRLAWYGGTAAIVVALVFAMGSSRPSEIEQVAEEFERLPDPVQLPTTPGEDDEEDDDRPPPPSTTTTTCPPPPPLEAPLFGDELFEFDESTVTRVGDPGAPLCGGPPTRVLVVGDSTGRGAANSLRRHNPTDLEVWDRTELGCGMYAPGTPDCPHWREHWRNAVDLIQPDVVVAYLRVSDDMVEGRDPEFLSVEGSELRRSQFREATQLLSRHGAEVVWVLPPELLPRGTFYCDGRATNSPCDPAWIERWRWDVIAVASEFDAPLIDVKPWVEGRAETAATDRPDGLHFSGAALDEHGAWLLFQLRTLLR